MAGFPVESLRTRMSDARIRPRGWGGAVGWPTNSRTPDSQVARAAASPRRWRSATRAPPTPACAGHPCNRRRRPRVRRTSAPTPPFAFRGPRTSRPRAGREANLIVIAHPNQAMLGRRYRVTADNPLEVGRSSETTLSFPDVPSISRRHARLMFADGEVWLEDLGSRNGTFLNDEPLRESRQLASGDRFQVGTVRLQVPARRGRRERLSRGDLQPRHPRRSDQRLQPAPLQRGARSRVPARPPLRAAAGARAARRRSLQAHQRRLRARQRRHRAAGARARRREPAAARSNCSRASAARSSSCSVPETARDGAGILAERLRVACRDARRREPRLPHHRHLLVRRRRARADDALVGGAVRRGRSRPLHGQERGPQPRGRLQRLTRRRPAVAAARDRAALPSLSVRGCRLVSQ